MDFMILFMSLELNFEIFEGQFYFNYTRMIFTLWNNFLNIISIFLLLKESPKPVGALPVIFSTAFIKKY